ncbi:MAG TPA: GAF domain-containing protein [Burkholderiales bacterium]|nr:GAF domain-containing protein [Burkholderiales bacterium]
MAARRKPGKTPPRNKRPAASPLRRALAERDQALRYQAATAEILASLSRSTGEARPVFEAIVRNVLRLFSTRYAAVFLLKGDELHLGAAKGDVQFEKRHADVFRAFRDSFPQRVDWKGFTGKALRSGRVSQLAPIIGNPKATPQAVALAKSFAYNAMLHAPLMLDGKAIGTIGTTRPEGKPFGATELALFEAFAAQAVIAIENARLFNETREALERQTATSDILGVIAGSPRDVQPVFDSIAQSCVHLFGGMSVVVTLVREGNIELAAFATKQGLRSRDQYEKLFPLPLNAHSVSGRAILSGEVVYVPDVRADMDLADRTKALAAGFGFRNVLCAPLIRDGRGIGTINVIEGAENRQYTPKQIELLRTFANQAVIAIENVRLFNETKEALERQTATAEILKVIAGSPADTQPVFDAIARSAQKLFAANSAAVARRVGDMLHLVAHTAFREAGAESLRKLFPTQITGQGAFGKAVLTGKPAWIVDAETDPAYSDEYRKGARERGSRSLLAVPMLREGVATGVIAVTRREPGTFSNHQIELLETFADQAVIAIENVRLFNETKETLERQTATSEILQTIARSQTNVQPVFDAMVRHAARLCNGLLANVFRYDGEKLHFVATSLDSARYRDLLSESYPMAPNRSQMAGRAILAGTVVRLEDALADPEYDQRHAKAGGWRRIVAVPLMRGGSPIGVIVVTWGEAGPVPREHEDLLQTFADQAVIAIENVRLFNETKEALEWQKATAEVLSTISGSMTDAQPVFESIVRILRRLFGARYAVVQILRGDIVEMPAADGGPEIDGLRSRYPRPLDDTTIGGRAMLSKRTVQITPVRDNPEAPSATAQFARDFDFNSVIFTPMLFQGKVVGAVSVAHAEAKPFHEREVDLIRSFADQAVIAIENARLFNETKEALEKQTATAEILHVISSTPTDTGPVFEAIVRNATRLCDAVYANVFRFDGERIHWAASHGWPDALLERLKQSYPAAPDRSRVVGRVILDGADVRIEDTHADTGYDKELGAALRYRRILGVPLMREGRAIGVITVGWAQPGAILQRHEDLLRTFAAQAVIAIENVRLFNETKEALERQTATSEVLKVIAGSPADVKPVFNAILRSAVTLCDAELAAVFSFDGKLVHMTATHNWPQAALDYFSKVYPSPPDPHLLSGRTILTKAVVQIPDSAADEHYDPDSVATGHWRRMLGAPMLRGGKPLGALVVAWREPGNAPAGQVELLQTFADQAAIAIENVRLFNETNEALERQTATADILRVISESPTDVQPVFETILDKAIRLCDAHLGGLFLQEPDASWTMVSYKGDDPSAYEAFRRVEAGPHTGFAKLVRLRRPVHIPDLLADSDTAKGDRLRVLTVDKLKARTFFAVPLLKDGRVIGAVVIYRREVRPFADAQIRLVTTFADQAVIAIENVRLFNETKEALERQTATADILKVISGSPTNIQPVLDAVAATAARLCEATDAIIQLREGDSVRFVAHHGSLPNVGVGGTRPLSRELVTGRAILEGRQIHVEDLQAEASEYPRGSEIAREFGYRTLLATPLIREGTAIGSIMIRRAEARPFTETQLALMRTFADQAVIAIENVRLFNETKEALEQQKASAEVLGAISGSIADTKPVFDKILTSCERLFEGDLVGVTVADGDTVRLVAYHGPEGERLKRIYPLPLTRDSGTGWAILNAAIAHFPDIEAPGVPPGVVAGSRTLGVRAIVFAPMLFEGRGIGAIWVARAQSGPFTDKQVAQLRTFADQAVIAIQNARLFREIQEKSAQLEVANKHKSDFLANMSHELRTPLNAIIGFSEVLLERMFGEVNEKQVEYLKDIHESGRHLLSLINDILDLSKIEAGRMELELSSFHLPSAISNAMTLVRERAQRHGIQLGMQIDPRLGGFEADERKVKQILLNLLSNAVKFTPDGGRVDVVAKLDTDKVEIAVKDTGVGIAAEDQPAVFEEFKQVGADYTRKAEGTGLGLALTKRLVELHGGEIALESEPGKGSTFTVKLPLR